jgi:uroporphyrinogen decarboxylase
VKRKVTTSTKERFKLVAHGQRPGDVLILDWFHKTLVETPPVWVEQGAPSEILGSSMLTGDNYGPMNRYFGYEHFHTLREVISGIFRMDLFDMTEAESFYNTLPIMPPFERQILEEDESYRTERHFGGEIIQVSKRYPWRMPKYLDHPVKDRKTWLDYKKRLNPETSGRLPAGWEEYIARINNEDVPNMLGFCGFFGPLRNMMGLERALYMFYDNPLLVEEIMEHILDFNMGMAKIVLGAGLKVDMVMIWEDMAYKVGSLISPEMFRRLMIPRYRKLCDMFHSYGIEFIFVDSDGNIEELIGSWFEVGVNVHWPLEVAAGMNAVALRKKYGNDMIMIGNIDKRVFRQGKEAVRTEVMSKVPYLAETGGYIPGIDHNIGPDVPLREYRYYLNLLRDIGGMEPLPE